MAKRKKINKADEAYILANLDKNSLEISEEIGLEQDVAAAFIKSARKDLIMGSAKLKNSDGQIVGATLTPAMADYVAPKTSKDNLDAPHIFRRQNKKEQ